MGRTGARAADAPSTRPSVRAPRLAIAATQSGGPQKEKPTRSLQESQATSRNNSLQAAPPWSEEKNAPRRSLVLSFWKARRTDLLSATAHLQVFGDLFNAMIDPETEKKKRTPAHMPGFAVAAANPDLAVKMVLRKEHAKKAAWWKAHARLSSPSGMPCDTLCEIIKNE